ncbi:MAG: terpene cyclase/mutase family protein [Fuerstia sp.]|nr:terpene cyclase/mutase family protein [Fuerstiella sp.]
MNPTCDNQPAPQTPEQFAEFLRKRVQEAISASVHHASLSQQYLSLSQRYSALAEQALSGNVSLAFQSADQLEREAATGIPAAPIAAALSTADADAASLASGPPTAKTNSTIPFPEVTNPALNGPAFYSPTARFTGAATGAEPLTTRASADAKTKTSPEPISPADQATEKSPLAAATLAPRRKKRRPVSVRSVLERARQVGLEAAEKVRVKAKKSDLKPQLRTTTEELTLELKRGSKPAGISLVLTGLALLILALRQMEFFEDVPMPPIIASMSTAVEPVEESIPIEPPAEDTGEQLEQPTEEMIEEPEPEPEPEPVPEPMPEPIPEPMPEVEMADASLPETPDGTAPSSPEPTTGADLGAIDNRSEAGRKVLLEKFGGSAASESAVGFALEWLAARQRGNGTWDFVDVGPCTHKGTVNNPIGGTAYALLPFLAAGQTHKEGQYQKQVQAGLAFLTSIGVVAPAGYDLRGVVNKADDDTDPNYAYYVHGAATLALCEAYGMTKDRKLKQAAEGAVSFLIKSQDPRGGGWRYNPQQPGSTSATAIQVMALKAAEKAGIKIPDATWKGISFYLDSVAVDGAGRYGYEVEKKTYAVSVTSMALLSRMYLGWGRDDGDMRAGIALIDKSTSTENYYTNYFSTQVMKNWGGSEWDRWNGRMRDDLIARQETDGPGKGSWTPRDRADYSLSGGRLLTTCLATLTLEVYYRNKPLLPEIADPGPPANLPSIEPPTPATE